MTVNNDEVGQSIVVVTHAHLPWCNWYYIVIILLMIILSLKLLYNEIQWLGTDHYGKITDNICDHIVQTLINITVYTVHFFRTPARAAAVFGIQINPISRSITIHTISTSANIQCFITVITGPEVLIHIYYCVPADRSAVFGPPLWRSCYSGFGRCAPCSQSDLQCQQGPSASRRHHTAWQ